MIFGDADCVIDALVIECGCAFWGHLPGTELIVRYSSIILRISVAIGASVDTMVPGARVGTCVGTPWCVMVCIGASHIKRSLVVKL
jgi:hypothetical protein